MSVFFFALVVPVVVVSVLGTLVAVEVEVEVITLVYVSPTEVAVLLQIMSLCDAQYCRDTTRHHERRSTQTRIQGSTSKVKAFSASRAARRSTRFFSARLRRFAFPKISSRSTSCCLSQTRYRIAGANQNVVTVFFGLEWRSSREIRQYTWVLLESFCSSISRDSARKKTRGVVWCGLVS